MNRLRTKCCTANVAELSSCRLEADVPVLGVRLKLAVGHKATHALFALKRTLPRMNPHVNCEMVLAKICLLAHITGRFGFEGLVLVGHNFSFSISNKSTASIEI